MRVGLLTGGGDCPGINAVIRAIVRKGCNVYHDEMFGFQNAWDGVMDQRYDDLTVETDARPAAQGAARCSAPAEAARSTTPTGSRR